MPTIDPMFSILIPSIPERVKRFLIPLMEKLESQIACSRGGPTGLGVVEVLSLIDNKTRSIGLKRDALLQSARGDWVAFVDDDDDVASDYVISILAGIDAAQPHENVIVFDQWCTIDEGPGLLIRHGMEHENTEVGPDGATRKPWHHNVWRSSLAKQFAFPDASYGEDADWLKKLWQVAVQRRIPGVLHRYHYNSKVTAAEATFPKESA